MTDDTAKPLDAALDEIQDGRARNARIILTGECTTTYDGKAVGSLSDGDRDIIVKQDGSLSVHAPEGVKPQNWLDSGGHIETRLVDSHPDADGEALLIQGRKSSGDTVEELTIVVNTVYSVQSRRLVDGQTKELSGTEADLKERLLDDPELIEDGFRVEEDEYATGSGPADIFGYDSDGNPCLVELKQRQVSVDAVRQLQDYINSVTKDGSDEDFRGLLIAPDISERAQERADDHGFTFVSRDPRRKTASETTTLDQF